MKTLLSAMVRFYKNTTRSENPFEIPSDTAVVANDKIGAVDDSDMRKWFNSTYGKEISREEAEGLVHAKRRGSFMTEIDRVLKSKNAAKAI